MNEGCSVLVIDDDGGVRKSLRLCLEAEGARMLGVATASGAVEALERARFDLVFLDLWLGADAGMELIPDILRIQPGIPIVVITAHASFESAVQAIKQGASDYLPKPFAPEQVRLAVRRAVEASALKRRVCELEERLEATHVEDYFDTASEAFRSFLADADRVAHADVTVLLRGESGTGKNVLVRWLRAHSPRATAPLVSVNCPTLSSDFMSSALFGHKRGAFTTLSARFKKPRAARCSSTKWATSRPMRKRACFAS
jgi:NtrC-family two-component system response regulator AlgB